MKSGELHRVLLAASRSTPDTAENEFKEEHYRRIAYANEHFPAASLAGRPTVAVSTSSRPADEIESHPSGGQYERPMEEGGGSTSTFPLSNGGIVH